MTEPTIHPDDPLFLASRQLDGDLCEAESKALGARLAASSELADAARQMRSVDEVIRRTTPGLPVLDWTRESELVLGRIADDCASPEGCRIDAALKRWAQATSVEDVDLARHFIAGVAGTAKANRPRRLVLPWAVPLAAAAAIAMIVMGPWFGSDVQRPFEGPAIATLPAPIVDVVMGPMEHSTRAVPIRPAPHSEAPVTNVVVFDRGSAIALGSTRAGRDPGFITVGVAKATLADEVPPL